MEEDIVILEKMIKRLDENAFDIYRKAPNTEDYLGTITGKEILATENLIARKKELEEELEDWKFTKQYVEENYVPVSKVKKVMFDIEEALSFARTGRYRRDKIQCQILENIRNKLEKELLD